jgi:endonuclease YncB( thermonuclease family)
MSGTVVGIEDADTFVVQDKFGEKRTVRLSYIDAPETSHGRGTKGQRYGDRATDYARSLAPIGSQAQIESQGTDQYGRTLGEIHNAQGSVNLRIVEAGLAHIPSQTIFSDRNKADAYSKAALKAYKQGGAVYGLGETPSDFRQRVMYLDSAKQNLKKAREGGDPQEILQAKKQLNYQKQKSKALKPSPPKPPVLNSYDLGEFGSLRKTTYSQVDSLSQDRLGQGVSLPYMPTQLKESFFDRYIGRSLPMYRSTTATYEMFTSQTAPTAVITADREIGTPSLGHQINRALGFKFYHEGYGILGSAARSAGRFLDNVTGFHAFQYEKMVREGRLEGTPLAFHRTQYRDNSLEAGPIEKMLGASTDAAKGIAVAIVGYGASFASQLGIMAIQEEGLAYLSSQTTQQRTPLQNIFRGVFSTPESRQMDAAIDYVKDQLVGTGENVGAAEILKRAHQVTLNDPDKLSVRIATKHADIGTPLGFINSLRRYESEIVRTIGGSMIDIVVPAADRAGANEALTNLAKRIKQPVSVREDGLVNFGRSRVQDLAQEVDKIARAVPSNPIYWIPSMRQWMGVTTADDNSIAEVFGDNLMQNMLIKFDVTARVTANIIKQPIQSYRAAMKLFEDSRSLVQLEQQYTKSLRDNIRGIKADYSSSRPQVLRDTTQLLETMVSTSNAMAGSSLVQQTKLMNTQASSYVGYNLGQDADQIITARSSRFKKNIRTLLVVGGVLGADYLFDQFILRTQGASLHSQMKLFDAVRNDEGQVMAFKFNGAMPAATALGVAGVAGLATGSLFPYFAKTRLENSTVGKMLYHMGDHLRTYRVATQSSGLKALSRSLDQAQQLTKDIVSVKAKFNMRSAAVGAVMGLVSAKVAYVAVSALLNNIHNRQPGRELDSETESVAGLIKATLNKTRYTTGQGLLADITPSSVATRGVLGHVLKELQSGDPTAAIGMNVYSIAQQTNLGFVQFATLLRTDPTSNQTTLSFGMQLLPMLGMGVNPTLPIALRLRANEKNNYLNQTLANSGINPNGPLGTVLGTGEQLLNQAAGLAFFNSFVYSEGSQVEAALGFLGAATLARGTIQRTQAAMKGSRPGSMLYNLSNLAQRESKYLSPMMKVLGTGFRTIESMTGIMTGFSVAVPQAMMAGGKAFIQGTGIAQKLNSSFNIPKGVGRALPFYLTAMASLALTDPDTGPGSHEAFENPFQRGLAAAQLGYVGYLGMQSGVYSSAGDVASQIRLRGPSQKVLELVPGLLEQQQAIASSTNLFRRSSARMKLAGTLLVTAGLTATLGTRLAGEMFGQAGLEGLYKLLPALRLAGPDPTQYAEQRGNPLRAVFQTTSSLIKKLTGVNLEKLTGLYVDTPNLFTPLLYPTGASMDQTNSQVRFYSQIASPTSDISYASYGMFNYEMSKEAMQQLSAVLDYNMNRLDESPAAAEEILAMYRGAVSRRKKMRVDGITMYEQRALTSSTLQTAFARREFTMRWISMQRASELAIDQLKEGILLGRTSTSLGKVPYQGYDPLQALSIDLASAFQGTYTARGSRETLDDLIVNITSQHYYTAKSGFFTQIGGINKAYSDQGQTAGSTALLGSISTALSIGTLASTGIALATVTGGMERAFLGESIGLRNDALKDVVRDFYRVARSGRFDTHKSDTKAVAQLFSKDKEVITAAYKIAMPEGMQLTQRAYWYQVMKTYGTLTRTVADHIGSMSPYMQDLLEGRDVKSNLASDFQQKIYAFMQEPLLEETMGLNPKRYEVLYTGDFTQKLEAMIAPESYGELEDYANTLKNNRRLSSGDRLSRLNIRRAQLEAQAFEQHMMRLGEIDTTNNVKVEKVFETVRGAPTVRPITEDVMNAVMGAGRVTAFYASYGQDVYTLAESSAYLLSSEDRLRDQASLQLVRASSQLGLAYGLERVISKVLFSGKANLPAMLLAGAIMSVNFESFKNSRLAQGIVSVERGFTSFAAGLVSGVSSLVSKATGPLGDALVGTIFEPMGEKIGETYAKGSRSMAMAIATSILLPQSLYKQQIYKEAQKTFTGSEPFVYNQDIYHRNKMSRGLSSFMSVGGEIPVQANVRGSAYGFLDNYYSERYFNSRERIMPSIISSFSISSMNRLSPTMRMALERRQDMGNYAIYGAMMRRPAPAEDNRVALGLMSAYASTSKMARQLNSSILPQLREEFADISGYVKGAKNLQAANPGQLFRRQMLMRRPKFGMHLPNVQVIFPDVTIPSFKVQTRIARRGFSRGMRNLRYVTHRPGVLLPIQQVGRFFEPVASQTLFEMQKLATAAFLGVSTASSFISSTVINEAAGGVGKIYDAIKNVPQIQTPVSPGYAPAAFTPFGLLQPVKEFTPFGLLPPAPSAVGPALTDGQILAMRLRKTSSRMGRNLRQTGTVLKDMGPAFIDMYSMFGATRRVMESQPDRQTGENVAAAYRESLGSSFSAIASSIGALQGRSLLSVVALGVMGFAIGDRMGYRMAQYDVHEYKDSRNKLYASAIIASSLSVYSTIRSRMIANLSRSEVSFDGNGNPRIDMSESLQARLKSPRNSMRYQMAEFELLHEKMHVRQARKHLKEFNRPGFTASRDLLGNQKLLTQAGASSDVITSIDRLAQRSAQGALANNQNLDHIGYQQIYEQEFEANSRAFIKQRNKYGVSRASRIVQTIDDRQSRGRFEGYQNTKTGLFQGNLDKLGANAIQLDNTHPIFDRLMQGATYHDGTFSFESGHMVQSIHDLSSGSEDPIKRTIGRKDQSKSAKRSSQSKSSDGIRDFDRAEFTSVMNPDLQSVKSRTNTPIDKLVNHADPPKLKTIKDLPRYQNLLFFDLETSYSARTDLSETDPGSRPPIAEVAYRKITIDTQTGRVQSLSENRYLVQPYYDPSEMTGGKFNLDDLAKGKAAGDVLEELMGQLDGAVLAGHNISKFDIPVLQATMHRLGRHDLVKKLDKAVTQGRYIDTLNDIDPKRYRELGAARSNLGSIYEAIAGEPLQNAHTAMADVNANVDVYQGLIKHLNNPDISSRSYTIKADELDLINQEMARSENIKTRIEAELLNPDLSYNKRLELEAELLQTKNNYEASQGGALVKQAEGVLPAAKLYSGSRLGAADVMSIADPALNLFATYRNRADFYQYMLDPRPTGGRVSRAVEIAQTNVSQNQGAMLSFIGSMAGLAAGSKALLYAIGFGGQFLGLDITGRGNDYISEVMRDASADGIIMPGVSTEFTLRMAAPALNDDIQRTLPKVKGVVLGLKTRVAEHLGKQGIEKPGVYLAKQTAKYGARAGAGFLAGSILARHAFGYGYTRDGGRDDRNTFGIMLGGSIGAGIAILPPMARSGYMSQASSISTYRGNLTNPTGNVLAVTRPDLKGRIKLGLMNRKVFSIALGGAALGLIASSPDDRSTQKLTNIAFGVTGALSASQILKYRSPTTLTASSFVGAAIGAQFGSTFGVYGTVLGLALGGASGLYKTQILSLAQKKAHLLLPQLSGTVDNLITYAVKHKFGFKGVRQATRSLQNVINSVAAFEYERYLEGGIFRSGGGRSLVAGALSMAALYYLQNDDEKSFLLAGAGGAATAALVYSGSIRHTAIELIASGHIARQSRFSGLLNRVKSSGIFQKLAKQRSLTINLAKGFKLGTAAAMAAIAAGLSVAAYNKLFEGNINVMVGATVAAFAGAAYMSQAKRLSSLLAPLSQAGFTGGFGALGYLIGDRFSSRENDGISVTGVAGAAIAGGISAATQYGARNQVRSSFRVFNRYIGMAGIGAMVGHLIGNSLDDDDSKGAYVGAAVGIGLAYLAKPAQAMHTKIFAQLFRGAVTGGVRHKALDYAMRRGGVLSGAFRVGSYGVLGVGMANNMRLLMGADNFSGGTRERYVKSTYSSALQTIAAFGITAAFKNDLVGVLASIGLAPLIAARSERRAEFMAKGRATETDLVVGAVSNTLFSLKTSRLIRHAPQLLSLAKAGRASGNLEPLVNYAQNAEFSRMSRSMSYARESGMLNQTDDLFNMMSSYTQSVASRNTKTARLYEALRAGAVNSNQAVQQAAKSGLHLSLQAARQAEQSSRVARGVGRGGRALGRLGIGAASWTANTTKAISATKVAKSGAWFAGRIFDVVEYGIGAYDVFSGLKKAFSLNYGSSKEQHQLAYSQAVGGAFRLAATLPMSILAKSLYATGAAVTATGVGAGLGLGMIALGVTIDTLGSDLANYGGRKLGSVLGTASYYKSHPDRLLRDAREAVDRLLGGSIQQRLVGDNTNAESYIDQVANRSPSSYTKEKPGFFKRAFNLFNQSARALASTFIPGLTLGLDLFRRGAQRVRVRETQARQRAQELPMTVGAAVQTYTPQEVKAPEVQPVRGTVSVQQVSSRQPSNPNPRPSASQNTEHVVSYDAQSNRISIKQQQSASDHFHASNRVAASNTADPSFVALLV